MEVTNDWTKIVDSDGEACVVSVVE
jgi:hypothetical protein